MQGMLQDAVLPGQAVEGGVAQLAAPMDIAKEPEEPIAGVAGPGELPSGMAPLAVAGPRSHAQKMAAKARLGLWQNPDVLQVLDDRRRTAFADGSEAPGDPGPAAETVVVTTDIATQLKTLSGFDVAGYMPRSATANSIAESRFPLADQLAILSHICTVVGYGIDHPASAARLRILAWAFKKGKGVIREHPLDYFQTMMVPPNHNRLVKPINSDLTRTYFGRE